MTFDVTVNQFNNPPTIDTISDLGLLEDAGNQVVNFSGITAGASETQPLAVTATSNNPALIPNPNVNYNSANTTGSLDFASLTNQFGIATISVTITDGGLDGNLATLADNGLSSTAFDVIVNPVNDEPTVNAIDDIVLFENAAQQVVQLDGITSGGGETQELQVTATSSNIGLMVNPVVSYTSANPTGSITFTPLASQSGSTIITVSITDAGLDGDIATGGDNSTTQTAFNVIVNGNQ